MRLLPRSLFGRMVAVLVAVLALALSIGAAIHVYERDRLLEEAGAEGVARRIARAVSVLETQPPEERRLAARTLSSPTLGVAVGGAPHVGPYALRRGPGPVGALLERELGGDREIVVNRRAAFGPFHGPHPFFGPPVIHVRLSDGTWASFRYRVPVLRAARPLHLVVEALALLVAVSALAVWGVRRATRPLAVLAAAAEELGSNINRPPLSEDGPEEVRRAAHAFNRMQERLKGYIEDRGRVLAAIAHDLKTPLALLRLRAESLTDPELKSKVEDDLLRMERLVSETLDFVRALDSPEPPRPIDMRALLERLEADGKALGWDVGVAGTAKPYPGRPEALQRCVGNLVENAVRYGKRARVELEDSAEALRVRVRDEGPGIPEGELDRVFEPFYRVEGSRSRETGGTGLGLAIARTVARAHGGTLTLRNLPGGGLEALLTLPRI